MEYSSPLAAMRPAPCPAWGNRKDLPVPRSMYNPQGWNQTCNPSSFDFKNLSMYQQKPAKHDYFTLKPTRGHGSSPTSSLTADLDANFHIDKSPQAPTPRRSLFTTEFFRPDDDPGQLTTPPMQTESLTTPPILSSSPAGDAMDITPLPHKAPRFAAQVNLSSPSPADTPPLDDQISTDALPQHDQAQAPFQQSGTPSFIQLPERKRPTSRPSLCRNKAYSTNYVLQRPTSAETQLPPFRFGDVATNGLPCSSAPSPIEANPDSIVEDQDPAASQQMPPRRPSLGSMSRTTGSPSAAHVRKPSAGRPSFQRPQRKLMRRSLSMFQHPDDVMKEEQDNFEPHPSNLTSVMDVDQDPHPRLPHFVNDDEPDSLPRISNETMADVLDSKFSSTYDRVLVVDCRFEYEYSGGHIENAVNFNDKQQLTTELFNADVSPSTLLIFHCEYSVHRAPLTAKFIRNHDRNINAVNYPKLTYPEMYILDGGYSKFFAEQRTKCYPQNYVEMNDERHEQACERGMAKVKQRQKLFRNQTFAFGQGAHDESTEDSPTAQGRAPRCQSGTFDVGNNVSEGIGQSFARRMASY